MASHRLQCASHDFYLNIVPWFEMRSAVDASLLQINTIHIICSPPTRINQNSTLPVHSIPAPPSPRQQILFHTIVSKTFLVPMIFFSEHPLCLSSISSPPSLPLPPTHGISFPAKSSGIKIQWTHMVGHSIREFYDRHWELVWAYFGVSV